MQKTNGSLLGFGKVFLRHGRAVSVPTEIAVGADFQTSLRLSGVEIPRSNFSAGRAYFIPHPNRQSDPRPSSLTQGAPSEVFTSATIQSYNGAAGESGALIAIASCPLTETGEESVSPPVRPLVFWAGGRVSKARFSVKSCQAMRAMRRAVERMAVLAFLPRARLRL